MDGADINGAGQSRRESRKHVFLFINNIELYIDFRYAFMLK